MKKRTKYASIVFFCVIFISLGDLITAQDVEYWVWGGPDEDHGKYIYENEGFVYSYYREFTDTDSPDYLLKWNSNGINVLNISSNHSIHDITGYMEDIYTCGGSKLAKWDSNWTLIWNNTMVLGSEWNSFGFVDIWTDGSYILTSGIGETVSLDEENWIVLKWDMDGNQIWNTTYGSSRYDSPYSIWSDGDNVYVCGDFESWRSAAIVKWNSTGHKIWNKSSSDHNLKSIWGDEEGNVYTCGEEESSSNRDLMLIKWSPAGEKIWTKYVGKRKYKYSGSIVWGDKTNIFTIGHRFHEEEDCMDVVVLKWDFNGKVIAEKYVSLLDIDAVQDMWLSDEYIYLSGYSYNTTEISYESQKSDCFIMKISKNFISDAIPGYSVYIVLGIFMFGVGILVWNYRQKIQYHSRQKH